jgi:hypothetical protein
MQLIKRPKNFNYKQIDVPTGAATANTFPTECPCCGAERISTDAEMKGVFSIAEYACGGKYKSIPQIQNHTDKFRGACGEEELFNIQENVARLIVFKNMFYGNWTLFPEGLKKEMGTKVPTVKDHVIYKMSWTGGKKLSMPKDHVDRFTKWTEANYDEFEDVIDNCLGKNSYGRFLDPRFITGFTADWQPIYTTDPLECMERLHSIVINQYGNLVFSPVQFGGGSLLPTEGSLNFIGQDKILTA